MEVRVEEAVEEAHLSQENSQPQGHVSHGEPDVKNGGKCCAWMSRYATLKSFFHGVFLETRRVIRTTRLSYVPDLKT